MHPENPKDEIDHQELSHLDVLLRVREMNNTADFDTQTMMWLAEMSHHIHGGITGLPAVMPTAITRGHATHPPIGVHLLASQNPAIMADYSSKTLTMDVSTQSSPWSISHLGHLQARHHQVRVAVEEIPNNESVLLMAHLNLHFRRLLPLLLPDLMVALTLLTAPHQRGLPPCLIDHGEELLMTRIMLL